MRRAVAPVAVAPVAVALALALALAVPVAPVTRSDPKHADDPGSVREAGQVHGGSSPIRATLSDMDAFPGLSDVSAEAILRAARAHGAHHVRMFGSRARGDAGPGSDLDLIVQLDAGRSLLDLVSLKHELEALLGVRVDLLSEAALSPYLRDRILREAKPIQG